LGFDVAHATDTGVRSNGGADSDEDDVMHGASTNAFLQAKPAKQKGKPWRRADDPTRLMMPLNPAL
jgi:hypothetical protein